MLFPTVYIIFSIYVIFFRKTIERVAGQRIVFAVMPVIFLLILALGREARYTGWYIDRIILLISSWWFLFCGFLLSLPMLNLQRWISQKLIFRLRDYLTVFSRILLCMAFAAVLSALTA